MVEGWRFGKRSPRLQTFGFKYLAAQYKSKYPSALAFVKNSYIDDGLISVPSIQEAKDLIIGL